MAACRSVGSENPSASLMDACTDGSRLAKVDGEKRDTDAFVVDSGMISELGQRFLSVDYVIESRLILLAPSASLVLSLPFSLGQLVRPSRNSCSHSTRVARFDIIIKGDHF